MQAVLKRWFYALIFESVFTLMLIISNYADDFNQTAKYIFPTGVDGYTQQTFFILLQFFMPFVMVPIGTLLSPLFVRLYLSISKRVKSIEMVGYARYEESKREVRYHYVTRVIFGALLCVNIWVILLQSNAFSFWVTPTSRGAMFNEAGTMFNFPMVPWYWFPLAITGLLFSICILILDSGLVFVKKIREHAQFSDTERVGSLLWNIVKGYAGVSVIINFSIWMLTPYGREASMLTYPFMTAAQIVFTIATIDLMRNWGRHLIFNAVKKNRPPEIIALDYKRTPIQDLKELYERV
jgi:hypothetical protein